ncbi:hypothetical protein PspLS_00408 [Pyricularia sp. CBS 133598]|nr:hypothetical protein PspLS_00408 [Pyricularia sp. CBS 133598]
MWEKRCGQKSCSGGVARSEQVQKFGVLAVKSGLINVVEIEVEGTPATKVTQERRGGGVVRWESKVVLSPTDGTALAP